MDIKVECFEWKPGENDREYIEKLQELSKSWEITAKKAISKLKQTARKTGEWDQRGRCSCCGSPYATDSWNDYIPLSEQKFCYFCGAKMEDSNGWTRKS